ncbi:MAG: RNA polymerase sigma-70 factor [Bacteroidota bacterium]
MRNQTLCDEGANPVVWSVQKASLDKNFNRLFNELFCPLVLYANGLVGNLELSEDLVQEVFVKYWTKFNNVEDQSFARNYLYKSVHNAAIDHIRHQKVESRRLNSYLFFQEQSTKIDDIIACDDIRRGINKVKQNLPERCLEVFQLSRDEGLTYGQIAKKMSISIKTVETQMCKALRVFRKELAPLAVAIE